MEVDEEEKENEKKNEKKKKKLRGGDKNRGGRPTILLGQTFPKDFSLHPPCNPCSLFLSPLVLPTAKWAGIKREGRENPRGGVGEREAKN